MKVKALHKKFFASLCWFYLVFTVLSAYADNTNKEVTISSKKASFDQNIGIIKLKENVHLSYRNIIFKSDEMTLIFENKKKSIHDDFSRINKISAKGNVSIHRKEEIIKSDLAIFYPKDNKITMLGNVKIVQGQKAGISSEELVIDLISGTSSFSGNVKSKILLDIND